MYWAARESASGHNLPLFRVVTNGRIPSESGCAQPRIARRSRRASAPPPNPPRAEGPRGEGTARGAAPRSGMGRCCRRSLTKRSWPPRRPTGRSGHRRVQGLRPWRERRRADGAPARSASRWPKAINAVAKFAFAEVIPARRRALILAVSAPARVAFRKAFCKARRGFGFRVLAHAG